MKEHGKKNKKKRALIELIITISILLIFVLFHQIMLKVEEPLRAPLGQLVEVDGHKMSVYTEGTGLFRDLLSIHLSYSFLVFKLLLTIQI